MILEIKYRVRMTFLDTDFKDAWSHTWRLHRSCKISFSWLFSRSKLSLFLSVINQSHTIESQFLKNFIKTYGLTLVIHYCNENTNNNPLKKEMAYFNLLHCVQFKSRELYGFNNSLIKSM